METGNGIRLDRRSMMGALAASVAVGLAPANASVGGLAATRALIEGWVAKGLVPGVSVAVVRPGSFRPEYLLAGKTDFTGGSPVSKDTLWRIFSMSKPVTGIAIMQQIAAGKIGLDTPISEILPQFANMRVLIDPAKGLESRPAEKPIRVRHLITHSAGFTYSFLGEGALEREYARLGLVGLEQAFLRKPTDPASPDLSTFLDRLATLPLLFEPGSGWNYSVGLDVAGGLLEKLSGKTLDAVLADQLFKPLGMADTGFWSGPEKAARLSSFYGWVNPATGKPLEKPKLADGSVNSQWATRPLFLAGGAGLISSAENYARFGQMMLNDGLFEGRAILPRGLARLGMSNLMEPGHLFQFGRRAPDVAPPPPQGFGAGGLSVITVAPDATGSPLPGAWGWDGAAGTSFHVNPARGYAIVMMLQSIGDTRLSVQSALYKSMATDMPLA